MESIEKLLKTSFASAANQVTQLYVTSLQQQKQSYVAGYSAAIESVIDFVHASNSRMIKVESLLEFLRKDVHKSHLPTPNANNTITNHNNITHHSNSNITNNNTNNNPTANANGTTSNNISCTPTKHSNPRHDAPPRSPTPTHQNTFSGFSFLDPTTIPPSKCPHPSSFGNNHAQPFAFDLPNNTENSFNRLTLGNNGSLPFNTFSLEQTLQQHTNNNVSNTNTVIPTNNSNTNNNNTNNSNTNNSNTNNSNTNNSNNNTNTSNSNNGNPTTGTTTATPTKKRPTMDYSVPSTPPSELWDQLLKKVKIDLT